MNRYVPAWDRLADAVKFVVAAGDMEAEARRGLCQAISDGTLAIRVHPGRNATTPMNARGRVLDGKDVEIPTRLCPDDFDWNNSRPLQPWAILKQIGSTSAIGQAQPARDEQRTCHTTHLSWIAS